MAIAEKYNGEIIAADSRTLYKGMDIATAKPSSADRRRVPHHLIDILTPDQTWTAADFKTHAVACINEIASRHKLPILTGGTGLYIDAVLFDFTFQPPGDLGLRQQLQELPVEELQNLLHARSIPLPSNDRNPRHLIRRLEVGATMPRATSMRDNTLVIGLNVDHELLKQRIRERVTAMFAAGLEAEVRLLSERYGWRSAPLQTIGYREFEVYFQGTQTLAATEARIVADTIAYAKRQRTWFARNKSIHWENEQSKIEDLITTFLSK